MKIWVDADACPTAIKEILIRISERTRIQVVFVANQWLKLPNMETISFIQVADGPDIADDKIVELCEKNDLVITADIPLAARIVEKDAYALNPRGTLYDQNNAREMLSIRNFMDTVRESGIETGGPRSFGQKDRSKFANELDKFVTKHAQKN